MSNLKKIYVTGLHRAGTHQAAEFFAQQIGGIYVEEGNISFDDMQKASDLSRCVITTRDGKNRKVKMSLLEKGWACQCPGLAHRCKDLSQYAHVVWMTRNHRDVITSMNNANIRDMAWHLMKGFRTTFPDDPIWSTLKYDGSEDVHLNFVGYYTLLVKVKEYLRKKYLSDYIKVFSLEEMPYYDPEKELSRKKPLKQNRLDMVKKYEDVWEQSSEGLRIH